MTILEGNVSGLRRGAQRRNSADDITDWLSITGYACLKRASEDRKAWKLLIENLRLR